MKNRGLRIHKWIVALFGLIFAVFGILNANSAYAADEATMMKKLIFTDLWNCTSGSSSMNTEIDISAKSSGIVANDIFATTENKLLPSYGFQGAPISAKASCKDVFVGASGYQGALDYFDSGKKNVNYSQPGTTKTFLETMGYEAQESEKTIFKIKASYVDHVSDYYFGCNWFGDNCHYDITGEVESALITVTPNDNGGRHYSVSDRWNFFNTIIIGFEKGTDGDSMVISIDYEALGRCTVPDGQSATFKLKDDVNEFARDINNYFSNTTWEKTCYAESSFSNRIDKYSFNFVADDIVDLSESNLFKYESSNRSTVLSTLSGGMNKNSLKFSDDELYTLYYYYLDKSLPSGVQNRITCNPNDTANLTAVKLKDSDGTYKTCYVNYNHTDPATITVNVPQYDSSHGPYIAESNMQVVIDWLNSKDDIEGNVPLVSASDGSDGVDGDGTEQGDPCYDAGVEGMSWVLCPAVNNMASAIDSFESTVLEWMLAIDKDLYTSTNSGGSDGSATKQAWELFRSIANVLLIITFLAVIFSQLTGYGIDNYGVKKMLPRLVVMAILLNLSFIICQLAVDLSNILGSGLDNLFLNIGSQVYPGFSLSEGMVGVVAALFAALAGTGAVAGTVITFVSIGSGSGVMLVLVLALILVVALAAVLLFFAMIGARTVVIVLFVAISPIAFACYVLPNTQSLLKKWWSIFKAMLIMYPICGALHGLSYIIRGMVFGGNETEFWMAIIGVVAPFLPFFMLPSLLRGAITALGKAGGSLMAVGSAWQKGIRGGRDAVQNSEAYKSAMERGRRNVNFRRAGLQYDRQTGQIKTDAHGQPLERKRGAFGRFIAGGDAGIARARAQALKDMDTQNRERELMGSGFTSAVAGVRDRADAQKISEYEALLGRGDATATENTTDSAGNVTQRTIRVNTGNAESMAAYHMNALDEYAAAALANDQDAMREAMSKVKAAQNIMAKTDAGRTALHRNFEKRLQDSGSPEDIRGLSDAADHIVSNFGDKYKAVNREAHAMFRDLSTMDFEDTTAGASGGTVGAENLNTVQTKLADGTYTRAGINKYTAESLANADGEAIKRLVDAAGSLDGVTDSEGNDMGQTLRATAYEALQKQQSGTLNIKPEVANELRKMTQDHIPTIQAGSNEFYVRHEEDALRIGKATISVAGAGGTTTSFEGYAAPAGFAGGSNTPVQGTDGHWYYKDTASGRAWDATVGRYVNLPPSGSDGAS